MSTTTTTKESKIETPLDKRTGDTAGDSPGLVIPGKALRDRLGIGGKPAATAPAEKVEELPADEIQDKPGDKAKPKPAKKPAVAALPPRGDNGKFLPRREIEEITTAIIKNVTEKEKTPAAAVSDPTVDLTPKQKKKVAVFKRMEELNPANKGKADQYLAVEKKLAEYKNEWSRKPENKGKVFNLDDEEHGDFLTANDVDYDEDEYAEALADLRVEEKTKPFSDKLKAQEETEARQLRLRELTPKIESHYRATAKVFIGELGGDFAKLLNDGGVVVPDERDRLWNEGQEYRQVLGMAQKVESVAVELMALANDVTPFSNQNPTHIEIFQFINSQERAMMAQPPEERLNADGKEFATADEWHKLSESQRRNYWTFNDTDLSALYAVDMAGKAKKLIADSDSEFNARVQRRGYAKTGTTTQPVPAPREREERSPAGHVAPRMAPTGQPTQTQKNDLRKRMGL